MKHEMKTDFSTAGDLQAYASAVSAGTRVIVRAGGTDYSGAGVVLVHEVNEGKSTLVIDMNQCRTAFDGVLDASNPERSMSWRDIEAKRQAFKHDAEAKRDAGLLEFETNKVQPPPLAESVSVIEGGDVDPREDR